MPNPARSPFPGMDPWLEDPALWPNVHQRLITYASDALAAQVRPRYYVSIGERVYLEAPDRSAYPDVFVREHGGPGGAVAPACVADRPVVYVLEATLRREPTIEIQDAGTGRRVVTCIEVLSPSNKAPGEARKLYRRKQRQVLASDSHLVEIDLLRAGKPTVAMPRSMQGREPYRVLVSRADDRSRRELYPIRLRDRLPRVGIPLLAPDPDAVLDLQAVLEEAWAKGAYGDRVERARPPEPPLAADDAAWARELAGPPG